MEHFPMSDHQLAELELDLDELELGDLVTHASLVCQPACQPACLPSLQPATVITGRKCGGKCKCKPSSMMLRLHLSKTQLEDMVNYGFFYPDNNVSFGKTVYVCDVSSDQHQYALRKASGKHQYILANLLGQHVYSSPLPATSPPSNQLFPPSSSHLTGVFSLQSCYNMFDLASVDLEAFFDYSYSALDQEIFTAQSQFSALPCPALQCQIDDAVARKKVLAECDPRLASLPGPTWASPGPLTLPGSSPSLSLSSHMGLSPRDGQRQNNSHLVTFSRIGAD